LLTPATPWVEKLGAGAQQTAEPASGPAGSRRWLQMPGEEQRAAARERTWPCPRWTLPHGKVGPRWKTPSATPSAACQDLKSSFLSPRPPKPHTKPYLEAVGVPIAFTDGVQGVFVVQRCPLVGRHLRREIGKRRCSGLRKRRKDSEERIRAL